MRRAFTLMVLALGLTWLAGCAHPPSEGTVVARDHRNAYSYWVAGIWIPGHCEMVNKMEDCTPGINIPGHEQYVAESWSLKLRKPNGKTGWRDVGSDEFALCATGAYYPTCKDPNR